MKRGPKQTTMEIAIAAEMDRLRQNEKQAVAALLLVMQERDALKGKNDG